MKRFAALAAGAAVALSACSGEQHNMWQVVAVYAEPDLPGDLPADAAGKSNFSFSDSTFTGTTPCARVTGTLTEDTIDTVEIGDIAELDSCVGGARHTHEQLTAILMPGTALALSHQSEDELRVVFSPDQVDAPSIWLRRL